MSATKTRVVFSLLGAMTAWFAWQSISLLHWDHYSGHRMEDRLYVVLALAFIGAGVIAGKKIIQPDYVTTDIENIIIGVSIFFALTSVFLQLVVKPSAEATMAAHAAQIH